MSRDVRRVPKQDRARRSVSAILDATAELLGEEASPLTMSAIGERAGISKAAIYRYFPDQGAVVHELATRYLGELDEHLASRLVGVSSLEEAIVAIDSIVNRFYELMRDRPAMRRIWLGGPNSVVVSDLIAAAAHKSALQLHRVLAPYLDGDENLNVVRIELLVYTARAAVEMALSESTNPEVVMREFKRSVVLSARLMDADKIDAILDSFDMLVFEKPLSD